MGTEEEALNEKMKEQLMKLTKIEIIKWYLDECRKRQRLTLLRNQCHKYLMSTYHYQLTIDDALVQLGYDHRGNEANLNV